ncbi:hypothetical protein ZIOFF_064258 [Zingiber officinale]|uniref:Iron-binding zinc finger CDGSH type domain-containing protein n=1 Tax=Zingiber officinale TaxID=94328 RepID=A0A8J5EVV2_ZINOF|nr:hypothetical protein ZIOFF_064258 [Zingiber officinale]
MLSTAARLPSSSLEIRAAPRRRSAAAFTVRAEGGINPDVRKNEEKVVDSVVASELTKPLTAYCRYSPRSPAPPLPPPPPCSSLRPTKQAFSSRSVVRCWRSGTFPLCDGSHVKHNKATGDNVGPLLVKK